MERKIGWWWRRARWHWIFTSLFSCRRKTMKDSFLGSIPQPSSNIFLSSLFHVPPQQAHSKSQTLVQCTTFLYDSYHWPEWGLFQLFKKKKMSSFMPLLASCNTGPHRKSGRPVSIQITGQYHLWDTSQLQDSGWGRLSQIHHLVSSKEKRCYGIDDSWRTSQSNFRNWLWWQGNFLPHISC